MAMVGWRCGGRGGCGCGIFVAILVCLLCCFIEERLTCAYVDNISHRYVPHEECLGNSIKYYLSSILLDVKQNLRC